MVLFCLSKLRQSNSVRVLQVHKLNKHREDDQIQVLGSAYDAPRRKTSNVKSKTMDYKMELMCGQNLLTFFNQALKNRLLDSDHIAK